MEVLDQLTLGLRTVWLPLPLLLAAVAALAGLLLGVLPAIGTLGAMALLLPLVAALPPLEAMIVLMVVHAGAQFGLSMADAGPGEGRIATATAWGACLGGVAGMVLLALLAPVATVLAFHFGPHEYAALILLGLAGSVSMGAGSTLKALAMVVLGTLLGLQFATGAAGAAVPSATGLLPLAIGLFVIGEAASRLARPGEPPAADEGSAMPAAPARAWAPMLRGTLIGAVLGALPGAGPGAAARAAARLERRLAVGARDEPAQDEPAEAVAARVGPSSARSAGTQTVLLPALALGLPLDAAMALVVGAMVLVGVNPGPQLMVSAPGLFWGWLVVLGMVYPLLLAWQRPLRRTLGWLARRPPHQWAPAWLLAGVLGLVATDPGGTMLALAIGFGVLGFVCTGLGAPKAALAVGFVLGPMLLTQVRHAEQVAVGGWADFATRPLAAGLLTAALALLLLGPWLARRAPARPVTGGTA